MRSIILLSLLMQVLPGPAQEAQKEKEHPIDIAMDKAIEKNVSTAGMVESFADAAKKWEAEMNKNLGILSEKLDPDSVKALREAQQAWVTQREKEIDFLIAFYSKMQGTMYRIIYAEATMSMVRDRALKLSHMVEMLEQRDKE